MANKKCMVYETLNNVQNLQIVESANNEVRLSGVFGVCGVRNNNKRIYNKENYGKMVEALQAQIAGEGCPGELEHPNTMNITLENVSHKIESIEMNEDGTITGTVLLLNTPKGQIAKAIVEGGLPLYISSRGAGSIDESGHVTLSTIKTYDLVGTPGFSQAKLTLNKNQALECLNESLEDGEKEGAIWAIVEDDLLGGGGDDSDDKDKKKSDDSDSSDNKDDKPTEEPTEAPTEAPTEKPTEENNNNNIDKDPTMKEINDKLDSLGEKITNLEAELHIAQESLTKKDEEIQALQESLEKLEIPEGVNYTAIETWIKEEFAPDFKNEIEESINDTMENSINEAIESIANGVQNWVCEEFAPEVQNWVCEEFAPEVQNWVCEEFAPEVQNWVCEEFAPEVQNWITEEYSPVIEGWINEEFAPEHKENIVSEVNTNVSEFLESQKTTKLSEIDDLLEAIDNKADDKALETLKESYNVDEKYRGVYCVENMPAETRPVWEGLSDAKQQEIIRSSRMYDFTKAGVLESFWANADLTEKPINENQNQNDITANNYYSNIAARMKMLNHQI